MSKKLKAAFLVVAAESNKKEDKSLIQSAIIDLYTIMVKDYDEAVKTAINLVEDGVDVIELCGGFGNKGVSIISEAISYKIPVGVVRFDNHPLLENNSGDNLFK